MTETPVSLDSQRGMAAQKATEIRRLLAEVQANETLLRTRQADLELRLAAAPATTWEEAAEKIRYLLGLLAASPAGQDPRRQMLIDAALSDMENLSGQSAKEPRI
jgi:hypothetical protein